MANPQTENGFIKISTELWEAWSEIRVSGVAEQCLKVIIRKTYGWQKKADVISLSQFVLSLKIPQSNVVRALKQLETMNLIIKKDTPSGNKYSINKDYSSWKPLSKKIRGVSSLSRRCIKNDNKRVSKKVHTIDIKDNTIDKGEFPHLNNTLFKESWEAWLEVRKKLKVQNTNRALLISLNKLHKYPINEANMMLEEAIEKSWKGIYPLKQQFSESKTRKKYV